MAQKKVKAAQTECEASDENEPGQSAVRERSNEVRSQYRKLEGLSNFERSDLGTDSGKTGIALIDHGIIKKWRSKEALMFYKLQSNSYKFPLALIPPSLPFVWLPFACKRRFMVMIARSYHYSPRRWSASCRVIVLSR